MGDKGYAWLLAAVATLGLGSAAWLLSPELALRAGAGDWRGVSLGLRRAPEPPALTGGSRALVHFHDLTGEPSSVVLVLATRGPTDPARLHIDRDGEPLFAVEPTGRPAPVTIPVREGAGGIDVTIRAEPSSADSRGGYRLHEIRLNRRPGAARRVAQCLPAILGSAVLGLLWRRGARGAALLWAVLTTAGALGAAVELLDPCAAFRLHEGTRDVLQLGWIVVLGSAALARPGPAAAAAAVVGTVGALYLPTVHYGFVNEDFDFARPWSGSELAATLRGTWDPRGIVDAYFRPLVAWSLAADHALWGSLTAGYHLTNLAVHAVNGVLAAVLLRRLGLSDRAALAGALAWVAHPLAATAAAWTNQRTDGLAAVFYLAALVTIVHPAPSKGRATAGVLFTVLALACKEMAATLPLAAALCLLVAFGWEGVARRRRLLLALAAAVALYAALWVALFPEKLLERAESVARWEGLETQEQRLRWPLLGPALYAFVFAPVDYERWQVTPLESFSVAHLLAGALAPLLAAFVLRRSPDTRPASRVGLLGLIWPLVTMAPVLAIREVDIFRLGLLVCFAFALVWGALLAWVERRRPWLAVALGTAVVLTLATPARTTAAAWGPGGSMHAQLRIWRGHVGDRWWRALTPPMQRLYDEEVARQGHEVRLLER